MRLKSTVKNTYILEAENTLTLVEEPQIEMFVERNNYTFTPKNGALKNPYSVVSLFSGCGGSYLFLKLPNIKACA